TTKTGVLHDAPPPGPPRPPAPPPRAIPPGPPPAPPPKPPNCGRGNAAVNPSRNFPSSSTPALSASQSVNHLANVPVHSSLCVAAAVKNPGPTNRPTPPRRPRGRSGLSAVDSGCGGESSSLKRSVNVLCSILTDCVLHS